MESGGGCESEGREGDESGEHPGWKVACSEMLLVVLMMKVQLIELLNTRQISDKGWEESYCFIS